MKSETQEIAQAADDLKRKLRARGGKISEDEYRRRVAENYLKAFQQSVTVGPDPRIGLTEQELAVYRWEMIKDGISDGHVGRDAAREACEKGIGFVMLYGSYGQGKTLALKIAVAQAVKAGKKAAYANMSGVLDDLLLAYDEDQHRQGELLRKMGWWTGLEVLALDELDKVNATAWARMRIHQLLDRRYTMALRGNGVTIMAANTGNKGLDDLDGYLVSRLRDNRFVECGQLVELNGPDGRQVMPVGYGW